MFCEVHPGQYQYTFLQYFHSHKTYTFKQCAPIFSVHVYCKNVYCAYMSLGVLIHTIDELTESNVGIALDDHLDHF